MDVISSLGVILSEVVTGRAKISIDRLEILPLLASYEHHPIFVRPCWSSQAVRHWALADKKKSLE
jgi:hypothetical protein